MLPGFEALVEKRILKAQKNGELDDLPGQGKPLDLDDMNIPEDCRMAWRVLKNSGFLPVFLGWGNKTRRRYHAIQSSIKKNR